MANIIGSQGNIQKIRTGYRKVLALGEGVASEEFRMTFEGYSDISYLVQSTQLPALAREPIESFGPNGVQFVQQGRYKNAQEVPISFKEVITGKIYEFLRAQLRGKKYYTVKLALVGESFPTSNNNTSLVFEDCWIELEGVDLSVEDATLVRPSGTIHANWISYCDTDQYPTLSIG